MFTLDLREEVVRLTESIAADASHLEKVNQAMTRRHQQPTPPPTPESIAADASRLEKVNQAMTRCHQQPTPPPTSESDFFNATL